MDEKDREILEYMMKLKTNNLQILADSVKISKSSVQKRIKKMEDDGLIKGFVPELDDTKLPEILTAVSMIKGRYGPNYAEEIGKQISAIEGICIVYSVLGEYDFLAVIKARGRKDLEIIIKEISAIEQVERSNTITVLSTKLEDLTAFYRL
ncbi:MAG: Lrp/AsnC family transcriptional regulator [Ferroplasma sp.]